MRRLALCALALVSLVGLGGCGDDKKTTTDTSVATDTTVATDTETPPDATTIDAADTTTDRCEGRTGSADCPCAAGQTCNDDLACVGGTCVTATTSGLALPSGARGCEVLLSELGRVTDVRFDAAVRGTFVREAPRVAIAVVAGADVDLPVGAVEVVGVADPPATIVSARCVDAQGKVIPGATVTFR